MDKLCLTSQFCKNWVRHNPIFKMVLENIHELGHLLLSDYYLITWLAFKIFSHRHDGMCRKFNIKICDLNICL